MGGNGGRADVDWLCAGNSLNSLHSGCAADFLESATCRRDTRRCFQPIRAAAVVSMDPRLLLLLLFEGNVLFRKESTRRILCVHFFLEREIFLVWECFSLMHVKWFRFNELLKSLIDDLLQKKELIMNKWLRFIEDAIIIIIIWFKNMCMM